MLARNQPGSIQDSPIRILAHSQQLHFGCAKMTHSIVCLNLQPCQHVVDTQDRVHLPQGPTWIVGVE